MVDHDFPQNHRRQAPHHQTRTARVCYRRFQTLGNLAMKPLLHTMRQLHQRRINAFFFARGENSEATQLSLRHVPQPQDRTRSLREMFADQEYDDDASDVTHE